MDLCEVSGKFNATEHLSDEKKKASPYDVNEKIYKITIKLLVRCLGMPFDVCTPTEAVVLLILGFLSKHLRR